MSTTAEPVNAPATEGKIWAVLAHLSAFVGMPFVLPLIIYLLKRNESAFIAENAREAVNFHITVFLACILCSILLFFFIGFFLFIIVGFASFILSILAAIRAAEGDVYRYPCTLRLI